MCGLFNVLQKSSRFLSYGPRISSYGPRICKERPGEKLPDVKIKLVDRKIKLVDRKIKLVDVKKERARIPDLAPQQEINALSDAVCSPSSGAHHGV